MSNLPTRQTLLGRIKDQYDEESWADFVSYYKGYIFAIVKRFGLEHHDCEDLVQSVILKMWEKLPEFQYDNTRGKFRSWLARVTTYQINDFYKKSTRLKRALEAGQLPRLEKFFKTTEAAELETIFKDEWENYVCDMAWGNVRQKLAPKVEANFQMFLKGQDDATVAEELELSLSSVRVYRKRVQDKLYREVSRLERELN